MNRTEFEPHFQQAVEQEGSDYIEARQAVLAIGAEAVSRLEIKAQQPDWKVSLTAEILLGWLQHRTLFDQCTDDMQAKGVKSRRVRPITGEFGADRRAVVIASRGPIVVPRLLEILGKTHEGTQQVEEDAVLMALSYLADRRATLPLLDLVENSRDDPFRAMVVNVLGHLKDDRAVEPLMKWLTNPENEDKLRSAAALSLGTIGDSRALEALQEVLLEERSSGPLRQQVAYALGVLGDPRATRTLLQILDRTNDQELIRCAVGSLGRIGDSSVLPVLQRVEQQYPQGLLPRAAREARAAIEARSPQPEG